MPCPLLPCPLPTPQPLHCPALPWHEDKILSMPFLQGAFGFAPSWGRQPHVWGSGSAAPHSAVTVPCCPSRAMAKAPTTASTGTCQPTTASPHQRSWELDSWVSACSCLEAPQGRGQVTLAGPRWGSIAVPCAGPAAGVPQAEVQGGGTRRVPSVPAVPAVSCLWLFFSA